MSAGPYDIVMEDGVPYTLIVTVKDNAIPPQPVPLGGWTARMMIRTRPDAVDTMLTLTSTPPAGLVLGSGSSGTVTVSVSAEQVSAMPYDTGVYDLFLYDSAGTPAKVLKGTVTIEPAVTR